MSGQHHAIATLRRGLKACAHWIWGAPWPGWTFWKTEKSLKVTGVQTLDRPAGSIVSIQHMLSRIPEY